MKSFFAFALIVLIVSCNNNPEKNAPSPGTVTKIENHNDTSRLITDSVLIKDTNTADVETFKKIN
jgi:hypothetical protein